MSKKYIVFFDKMTLASHCKSNRELNWESGGASEYTVSGLIELFAYFKQYICISYHCYTPVATIKFTDWENVIQLTVKELENKEK